MYISVENKLILILSHKMLLKSIKMNYPYHNPLCFLAPPPNIGLCDASCVRDASWKEN